MSHYQQTVHFPDNYSSSFTTPLQTFEDISNYELPEQRAPTPTTPILNKKFFKELFVFEENDRDKKQLKREFKSMLQLYGGRINFKNLIDFYLNSSELFTESLKKVDANRILEGISKSLDSEHFTEKVVKMLCLNQAMIKIHREYMTLLDHQNLIID